MTDRPKIMTIYGTRPEAIKVAPVIKALERSESFDSVTLVTAQHREMLDQVNELFGIAPDFDLDIMSAGQTLNRIIEKVVQGVDSVFAEVRPDAVIVQGDTTTVMAAAIAAFNVRIPVVHLEAGLRSGDLMNPFPEEANRKLTSQLATLHLAPTQTSKLNLLQDGIAEASIAVTGNTVIDALLETVEKRTPFTDEHLADVAVSDAKKLLVTTHRRENLGGAMENIGRATAALARRYPDLEVILPVHKNPKVRTAVLPPLEGLPNVTIVEPLPYGEFTRLLSKAHIILTDSGGVQEEAPSLGKPVLVMRENTERPEAVEAGTVRLIGTDEKRIAFEVSRLLDDEPAFTAMANAVNPYGDGNAAKRTVSALENLFGLAARLPDFEPQMPDRESIYRG